MTIVEAQSFGFSVSAFGITDKSSPLKMTATEKISRANGSSLTTGDTTDDHSTSGTFSTLTPPFDSDYIEIPVVGLPGPVFTLIHSAALTGLSTSILVSISLLVYLCSCRRSQKKRKQQQPKKPPAQHSTGGGPQDVTNNCSGRLPADAYKVKSSSDVGDDRHRRTAQILTTKAQTR
jgi:hypothetical protein